MEFNITPFLNDVAQHILNRPFLVLMIITASYLLVRLLMILYRIIVIDSGIHYVTTQRSAVKMDTYHNPFFFDVNIQKANYLGTSCLCLRNSVISLNFVIQINHTILCNTYCRYLLPNQNNRKPKLT
ncbi:hypothetical protein X975_05305, partial [Stegodyphus mimosarum]